MINISPFRFYVFELFEDEIVPVENDFGYYQLRLRGYFKDHKPPTTRQLKQMGVRNGTKQTLLNGFSICGRKEQLEYLKAYILKELEKTKSKIYNHKVVELRFSYGYFNIAYYMGRRSVYGYKFNFNFNHWVKMNKKTISKDTLKELESTFEKIYDDYAWERQKWDDESKRILDCIRQKKLEKFLDENNELNFDEELESIIDSFREELVDKTNEELEEILNKRKIVLDLQNE